MRVQIDLHLCKIHLEELDGNGVVCVNERIYDESGEKCAVVNCKNASRYYVKVEWEYTLDFVPITFNNYQQRAHSFAVYPIEIGVKGNPTTWVYPALGLSGEVGELLNKLKKTIRDHDGVVDETTKDALKSELGDILWYVAELCTTMGFYFNDVAEANILKLSDREQRNAIKGDGDNR